MKRIKLIIVVILSFGITTAIFAQNVPYYVPNNGLIAWWPFNGNAIDESGNGNNGLVTGATLTTDRFNNPDMAYKFVTSNTITVNNSPSLQLTDSMSISFWVFPYSNGLTILRKGINFGVDFGNNNNTGLGLYLIFFLPNVYSTNQLQPLTWNHIVVVKDTSNLYIYINNVLNVTAINGYNYAVSNSPFTIGSWNNEVIDTKIDDIGIWNRPLSPKEIAELFYSCETSISIQPTSQTASINHSACFIASASDSTASYQWQTNVGLGFQNISDLAQYSGSNNDTLTVSNLTMANNNQLFRCIINLDGCPDTSSVVTLSVIDDSGISGSNKELLSVFPNPTHGQINIKADTQLIGSTYLIYNSIGKIILTGTITTEKTIIEFENFSNGIYLISVGDKVKQTFKVIKE